MEDVAKIAERLNKDLKKMVNIFQQNLAQIPSDCDPVVSEAKKDINDVMIMLKKGDTSSLEQIVKKYVDTNR